MTKKKTTKKTKAKANNKDVMGMSRSAEEILALIKKRQKLNQPGQTTTERQYEEYRKLQHEVLTKGQEYHKLGRELLQLEAMIDGCYPQYYQFWWEAELLDAFDNKKVSAKELKEKEQAKHLREIIKKRSNGSQGPQVETQVQQVADLRSMLKNRRTALDEELDLDDDESIH
tara:strand:+ start:744 stop:1259 length:516 start_codon:yes stop_codon:yes gene_type:complete